MDEAVSLRRRFERLKDGSYVCSEFSSGLWIRCITHRDGYFEHVDGGYGDRSSLSAPGAADVWRRPLASRRIYLRGHGKPSVSFLGGAEGWSG
jgi:hypothetical protein